MPPNARRDRIRKTFTIHSNNSPHRSRLILKTMADSNWNLAMAPVGACDRGTNPAEGLPWRIVNCLERICAVGALAALSPGLAVVGLTIYGLSRRTPLVAHLRVGQQGRPLWVLKFRTMWEKRPAKHPRSWRLVERIADDQGPKRKSFADPRVCSRFAGFCRRFSIDELPQLLHVATGKMSFIGPRPLTAGELEEYYAGCADEVLRVKPGLSGLWQVMGRNRLTYEQRRAFDLLYVRTRSLGLYLALLAQTPREILGGRNSC
jgi:exopolysaccharide production protein ExoY